MGELPKAPSPVPACSPLAAFLLFKRTSLEQPNRHARLSSIAYSASPPGSCAWVTRSMAALIAAVSASGGDRSSAAV